ncbi:hypothetical protein H0H92_015124, partial [Tricholoma furcatifolium]
MCLTRRKAAKKWEREAQQEDEFLARGDARSTDLVIIIMGATGAGKSTFINRLFDTDVAPVGHMPDSCTESVRAYPITHDSLPENRVILVDTPGFDDSKVPQSEI